MVKASTLTLIATLFAGTLHAQTPPPMETLTLEQAVERAIKNNPTFAQATQDILRAEGLLQQARAATMPFITAGVSSLVNSTERRFDDVVTSPQTQATLSAQVGMPVLSPSRWAAKAQAQDQVEIANLSTADARTQIAVSTALMAVRFSRVCEATWPTTSPVTSAPARCRWAIASAMRIIRRR